MYSHIYLYSRERWIIFLSSVWETHLGLHANLCYLAYVVIPVIRLINILGKDTNVNEFLLQVCITSQEWHKQNRLWSHVTACTGQHASGAIGCKHKQMKSLAAWLLSNLNSQWVTILSILYLGEFSKNLQQVLLDNTLTLKILMTSIQE